MIRGFGLAVAILAATPLSADELRPAPEYFVRTVMAATTAQNLALACPKLSFNITTASASSGTVIRRLEADGFSADQLETQMADPSDAIGVLQQAFLEKHDLGDAPNREKVCAAGLAEIAQDSAIGAFLTEVAQ